MKYTDRVDSFQIADPSYLPGWNPKVSDLHYDIVKWETHKEPIEGVDFKTGKTKKVYESCYVVAVLKWNCSECAFEFESVGTRWLDCNPTQAAIDMIKQFVSDKEKELSKINDDLMRQRTWLGASDDVLCPYCGEENSGLTYKFCPHCGRRVYAVWHGW